MKNIVICCDGTGNEIEKDLSNVLKLYQCLEHSEAQRVFYDPGIGTLSDSGSWARWSARAKGVFGMMTGWGLDASILSAYKFLIETYEDGDRIFLFGFSRGAYTTRAVAGMIYLVGLLRHDQLNLSPRALVAYKSSSDKNDLTFGWRFRDVSAARRVGIHFVGAWDTVSSVIVPRPDRFYIPSLQTLPYTRRNPGIRNFRHAVAIDEKRRMFRLNRWTDAVSYQPDPFSEKAEKQVSKQVWFAGSHSDVGGGWPEGKSGLAKIALSWMLDEAVAEGLAIDKDKVDRLVHGKSDRYVTPDALANINDSMSTGWRVLEWLPKRISRRERSKGRSLAGFYLPRAELRAVDSPPSLHPSVLVRLDKLPSYKPRNVLDALEIEDTENH